MSGKYDSFPEDDERFDFSKLTNENFWKEILSHSIKAFLYTIRKFWYLFILTGLLSFVISEIIFSMQVDKYHLSMTLRYGSIKNGLSSMSDVGGFGGAIGVGSDTASLGAVESFGSKFDGVPTPSDTENNFGFNLKDFLIVVRGKFVSPESFKEKFKSKKAKVTSFEASGSSTLAYLTATGADKQEVLKKAKELSDFLENLFNKRKRVILEKIDERLIFSREEYRLVSDQIKRIHKLEQEFGRTTEIISSKNTLYTQELSLRATLSEILSFKGENYIKDFEILSVNISPTPVKFLSRNLITLVVLVVMMVLTSLCIIILVFIRLKNIRDLRSTSLETKNQVVEVRHDSNPRQTEKIINKEKLDNNTSEMHEVPPLEPSGIANSGDENDSLELGKIIQDQRDADSGVFYSSVDKKNKRGNDE